LEQFLTISAMQIGLHIMKILYLPIDLCVYVSIYTHHPVM